MSYWNHIYQHFSPIAFSIGGINVHWYGIMYVLALLSAFYMAKWIIKNDKISISQTELDNYFIWVEIGVILGARFGYIIFYDTHTIYYLTNPWQIFNPFVNGKFVGISGMSYHGAVFGFLIASYFFTKKYKINFWSLMDVAAIAIPFGYTFGRIGNFLNQRLIGRVTTEPWGIYVGNTLRHPSQLYEAFLEGILIFIILFLYRKHKKFNGELIILYGILYGLARFTVEFYRQPDAQLGFICYGWMTMGQLLSIVMVIVSICFYIYKKITN